MPHPVNDVRSNKIDADSQIYRLSADDLRLSNGKTLFDLHCPLAMEVKEKVKKMVFTFYHIDESNYQDYINTVRLLENTSNVDVDDLRGTPRLGCFYII